MNEMECLKTLRELKRDIEKSTKTISQDFFRDENERLNKETEAKREFYDSMVISDDKLRRCYSL